MELNTALITGASSGIGRALALCLADQGVRVVLTARRLDLLREVAAQITARGGRAHVATLDVSDPVATTATIRALDDELGGIDLVIANAGVGGSRWAGKLKYEDCAPLIAVNVTGAVATLLALMDRMVARGAGRLVGISSIAQYRGLPKSAAYSASKAFLSTFLEGLRVDLRATGVRVIDVRPGYVRTPLTADRPQKLPFIVEAEAAARRIVAGVRASEPVVAFPWQLAAVMRSARLLPATWYDGAVTRARK